MIIIGCPCPPGCKPSRRGHGVQHMRSCQCCGVLFLYRGGPKKYCHNCSSTCDFWLGATAGRTAAERMNTCAQNNHSRNLLEPNSGFLSYPYS